ncbi:MAG: hypothetical protein HKN03_03650 [Acidimicrobiales bacterium]|nr:hypothetical protein [Acidimicrobiales bacterium]
MESKDDKDEIGLKDLVIYAPLGLVYDFQKVVPQLAKKGKSQVQLGLFLGRMAASRGQSTAERATADVLTTLATITARGITEFGQVVGLAPPDDDAPPSTIADPNRVGTADDEAARLEIAKKSGGKQVNKKVASSKRSSAKATRAKATKAKSSGPAAPRMPIAGYDDLTAREIIALLDDLTPSQRQRVRKHETAHRSRKTILAKLDRLDA